MYVTEGGLDPLTDSYRCVLEGNLLRVGSVILNNVEDLKDFITVVTLSQQSECNFESHNKEESVR